MNISMLKSKIHRGIITEANLHYVGSITIDRELMDSANILEYEKVHIVDIDNGNRLETYVIPGERHSGVICLNGAAARLVHKGDKVIIMAYCSLDAEEAKTFSPKVLFLNEDNSIKEITNYERHGEIK